MESIVDKWLQKAQNDYKIAKDEIDTVEPATDMICFHMQQCAEKYLKAFLVKKQIPFRRTHDIIELIEHCKVQDSDFEELFSFHAEKLNRYAVDMRYPDDFYIPSMDEVMQAVKIADNVVKFTKKKIQEAKIL